MTEQWKPIEEFDGYLVSDEGRVWSEKTRRFIAQRTDREGYAVVQIYRNNRCVKQFVHQLVARAFIEGSGPLLRHLDGDPQNNAPSNLAWGTQRENAHDTVQHGRNQNVNKTCCPQGHPYNEANTIYKSLRNGHLGRTCRICDRASNRVRQSSIRAAKRTAELTAVVAFPDDLTALQDTVIRQQRRINAVLAVTDEMTDSMDPEVWPWAIRLRNALRDVMEVVS